MPTTPTAAHLDPEVLNPLDRLRGTIRRYVVIEGLLTAAIFAAAWFAAAVVLDFGVFKVATWDWVLDAPAGLRAASLALGLLGLAAILAFRIARRLTTEFSYPALALVLERRFPAVLGGRLITAVELADVEGHERFGYSRELILQTIREARERVATVPADEVFDWRRLRTLGAVAAGLVAGVVLAGYAAYVLATGSGNPYRFGWRFAHVTAVLAERDLFLMNTPWPRRAYIELVGFPGDELRIGKDAGEPTVRSRAYRWVIADRAAPTGWRPMTWGDVTPALVGRAVPTLPEPAFRAAADGGLPADPAAWPLDQVLAVGLEDAASRAKLSAALTPDEYLAVRDSLERMFPALEEQAASPSMGRTLRKLDLPGKVSLVYAGQNKTGDVTLAPLPNQEFTAPVPDLKESVRFVVRAEDFRTAPRDITLVPPPVFVKLTRTEYQPAYLHHAPPAGEGYPALAGLRQAMPERPLSLTGDRTVFPVPAGTELVLTATADTDLTTAYLLPKVGTLPGATPGSPAPVPLAVAPDKRTVTVEFRGDYRFGAGRTFPHIYLDADGWVRVEPVTSTAAVEFDLVVEQADGVKARRPVLVQVVEDAPPIVEVAPDVIRKVGTTYLVTPKAKIPFNPESFVKDDHGLSKVAFDLTYWAEDSDVGRAMRAQLALRPLLYMPGPTTLPGVVAPPFHAVKFRELDKGDTRKTAGFGLRQFAELTGDLRRDTRADFLKRLTAPLEDAGVPHAVKRVELKSPDRDFFDVDVLKLGVKAGDVQPRYRIDLAVTATDTNYDAGPKTGTTPEPIRLLIVSEADLLVEINKEEETFAARLDDALAKLAASRRKWEYVRNTNAASAPDPANKGGLDAVRVRAQDGSQDVAKAKDVVGSIVREYRRIHQECKVNDVTAVTRDRFGMFANRVDRVMGESPPGVTEDERRQIAAGQLNPKMTFPTAEKKLDTVLTTFAAEKWADPAAVSDAAVSLAALELEVTVIRRALGELQTKEKLRAMLASVIEQRKRIRDEMRDWRERVERDLTKKEPELLPLGPIFLTKGETKRFRQGLNWRLFDKDDLTIRAAVNDAEGLTVPPMIRLSFEDVSLTNAFEYEVRAGNKVGDFIITLTPEVGDPVQVRVQVK
ncbi:MAG TPA: hypothetical protein VH092_02975 [Urbifossiella sp.]|jgi:hypothetical protein|nr:hypothetical protein [Urbifossiella sp.]